MTNIENLGQTVEYINCGNVLGHSGRVVNDGDVRGYTKLTFTPGTESSLQDAWGALSNGVNATIKTTSGSISLAPSAMNADDLYAVITWLASGYTVVADASESDAGAYFRVYVQNW